MDSQGIIEITSLASWVTSHPRTTDFDQKCYRACWKPIPPSCPTTSESRGIPKNSSRPPSPCPQQCPSPLYSPEARPRTNRVDKMIDLAKNLTWRFLLATGVLLSSLHSFNNMSGFYSLGHQQLKPMHSLVGVEVRMGLCSKGILFNFLSKNGTFQLIDGK